MKNLVFLLIVFFTSATSVSSQDKLIDEIGRCKYIGYYNGHMAVIEYKTWNVYAILEPDTPEGEKQYKLLERGDKKIINKTNNNDFNIKTDYIKDDFKIKEKVIRTNKNPIKVKYEIIIKSDKFDLTLPVESLKNYYVVNEEKDLIITEGKPGRDCEGCEDAQYITLNLAQIDLTKEEPKLENIGLRGKYLQIVNNHLYFHQYFEGYGYGEKYNLYRVPLNKWDETELVFRQSFRQCYVFPNENYMFASIYDPEKNNTRYILYSLKSRSYEYLKNLDSLYVPYYPHKERESRPYIGANMYSYKHDAPVLVGGQFRYVKNLPGDYPKKYRDIRAYYNDLGKTIYQGYEAFEDLPKKVNLDTSLKALRNHNFPRPEKPFAGTFITDQLMYEADKEELSELSKEELRLLRNAFFARLGYSFESEDLQEFFMQFDWYENSLDRKKLPNDKIIVPPEDKERVQLILEIEKNQ